ncbi:MAG: hypothetical protein ACJAY8_000943 [Sphingobacteriales bacterium]|jgi:hypothetical protein
MQYYSLLLYGVDIKLKKGRRQIGVKDVNVLPHFSKKKAPRLERFKISLEDA